MEDKLGCGCCLLGCLGQVIHALFKAIFTAGAVLIIVFEVVSLFGTKKLLETGYYTSTGEAVAMTVVYLIFMSLSALFLWKVYFSKRKSKKRISEGGETDD